MSEHHSIRWDDVLDSLPTECSRNHQTVEMINYERRNKGSTNRDTEITLKFFCPSCHQKLQYGAKKIGEGRYAATKVEILEKGQL